MLGKKFSGTENLKRKLAKQAETEKLSGSLHKFLKTDNQMNMSNQPNYKTDVQYPSTSSSIASSNIHIPQHQEQKQELDNDIDSSATIYKEFRYNSF